MTTLAAYVDTDRIWMGSDSLMTHGTMRADHCDTKWVIEQYGKERWAVAAAGAPKVTEFAVAQLEKDSRIEFFAPAVREEMRRIGWVPECANGDTPYINSRLLVITGGKLYSVEPAMEYSREVKQDCFISIGSGAHFAEGAWRALQKVSGRQPNRAMKLALESAIELDVYSGGPPWVVSFR